MAVGWTRGRRARSVLDIELISPYGQALRDPAREVTDFLRRASIVPTARKAATSTSTLN